MIMTLISPVSKFGCQKDNLIARDRLRLAAEMGKLPTLMTHIGLVERYDDEIRDRSR